NGQMETRIGKNDPAFLEARLLRERPCRTLFVRNIQYNLKLEEIKAKFEEYGEIKEMCDLIEKRGMYDIRASEKAKKELQGCELGSRKIDVHYSLPKDDDDTVYCDGEKNQVYCEALQYSNG
ncbi:3456_t:CDS:2, partial [Paraglomus occultum]